MPPLIIDRIESMYGKTLTRIGAVKEEIAIREDKRECVPVDMLDTLETLTARAVYLAGMLNLDYDSEYDA